MPRRARDERHPLAAPDPDLANAGFIDVSRRLTTAIDAVLALASVAVMVAWFHGRPSPWREPPTGFDDYT